LRHPFWIWWVLQTWRNKCFLSSEYFICLFLTLFFLWLPFDKRVKNNLLNLTFFKIDLPNQYSIPQCFSDVSHLFLFSLLNALGQMLVLSSNYYSSLQQIHTVFSLLYLFFIIMNLYANNLLILTTFFS
jgi:hypothetical protein